MTKDPHLENVGFAHPVQRERALKHRRLAMAQLIATVALVFSILVAATVVSFGIARADVFATAKSRSAAAAHQAIQRR